MEIKENKYLIFDNAQKINIKTFAKYCVNYFHRFFYSIVYKFVKPKKIENEYKYNVSICAIFKDEADYLKEWIEFHKIVGVEHFYLYNNNSSDNYLEVLKPYMDCGLVTLIDWPIKQGQMQAYQHWADNYKSESKWVGFIDIDEFVVPNQTNSIYGFLKQFDYSRPVVIMYWRYFGSSGIKNRDIKNLVTEDFKSAWYKYADIGKYFFNTKYDYVQDYKMNKKMHSMWGCLNGIMFPPVNVFNKICTCNINPVTSDIMPIQINHYLLKSYDEYVNRKAKRGGGVNPVGIHDMEYFNYHDSFSTGEDTNINKYMDQLKEKMKNED